MYFPVLCLLCILFLPKAYNICVICGIKFGIKHYEKVKDIVEIALSVNDHLNILDLNLSEKEMFTKLEDIDMNVIKIEEHLKNIDKELIRIEELIHEIPDLIEFKLALQDFEKSIQFINDHYDNMQKFVLEHRKYEKDSIKRLIDAILSDCENSASSLMKAVMRNLSNKNFFQKLVQTYVKNMSLICLQHQSEQTLYINLLGNLMMSNLKTFLLIQFSYSIQARQHKGPYKQELIDNRDMFNNYTKKLFQIFSSEIARSSTAVWRCDAMSENKEGHTYEEITNFLHGYILNKANLDKSGSCLNECEDQHLTKSRQCNENEWCRTEIKCPKVVNCKYVDSEMNVCKSEDRRRRYNFVAFKNSGTYGRKRLCKAENYKNLQTYWYYIIQRCSYCFCICEEGPQKTSDIYINLRMIPTNVSDNRVVTGVRFIKKNQIIHLQIQQGKILPNATIDLDTVQWIEPENYKVTDRNIQRDRDYHVLEWESRSFLLDDIKAPKDSVITGVGFHVIKKRLYLQIKTTRYNISSGLLQPSKSYIKHSNHIYLKKKFWTNLKLKQPGIPILSKNHLKLTTQCYASLKTTDYEKDAGQTTVPFFDAQPVTAEAPLIGLGLHHRGADGSGGYLALKIFTYNYYKMLKATLFSDQNKFK